MMRRFQLLLAGAALAPLATATTTRPRPPAVRTTRPRRIVVAVPSHSVRALVQQAVRDARAPGWSLLGSAHRLAHRARGDARALRQARTRLQRHAVGEPSGWHSRALAALIVAAAEAGENRSGPVRRTG
jgi:hypothetical protein